MNEVDERAAERDGDEESVESDSVDVSDADRAKEKEREMEEGGEELPG